MIFSRMYSDIRGVEPADKSRKVALNLDKQENEIVDSERDDGTPAKQSRSGHSQSGTDIAPLADSPTEASEQQQASERTAEQTEIDVDMEF